MALLGMDVGGVTPAPGSTPRATRFCVRAARRTALGEREEGVRLKKEVRIDGLESGTGAILRNAGAGDAARRFLECCVQPCEKFAINRAELVRRFDGS